MDIVMKNSILVTTLTALRAALIAEEPAALFVTPS